MKAYEIISKLDELSNKLDDEDSELLSQAIQMIKTLDLQVMSANIRLSSTEYSDW